MAEKVFIRNVSEELWRNLKASAAVRGMTISRAISEAIEQWLITSATDEKCFDWKSITALGKSRKAGNYHSDAELSAAIFDRKLQ